MTCGMAGVAGTVMVIYGAFLSATVPNALGNIVIASVISTPAGLAVAALMVPFGPPDEAEGRLEIHGGPVTLQRLFALPFRPVMWLIGVPWADTGLASSLMATKTVLNEFVAYVNFSQLPRDALSPRTRIILTYALCGFANFGSLGIMIGGLGAMVPARRHEIVALGIRSILSGTIATCMSGAVAGALAGG